MIGYTGDGHHEAQVKLKPLTYKDLLALAEIGTLSTKDALEHIAHLVDACQKPDHAVGVKKAFQWCDELEALNLDDDSTLVLQTYAA